MKGSSRKKDEDLASTFFPPNPGFSFLLLLLLLQLLLTNDSFTHSLTLFLSLSLSLSLYISLCPVTCAGVCPLYVASDGDSSNNCSFALPCREVHQALPMAGAVRTHPNTHHHQYRIRSHTQSHSHTITLTPIPLFPLSLSLSLSLFSLSLSLPPRVVPFSCILVALSRSL